jgi:hypothetical protein
MLEWIELKMCWLTTRHNWCFRKVNLHARLDTKPNLYLEIKCLLGNKRGTFRVLSNVRTDRTVNVLVDDATQLLHEECWSAGLCI